MASGKWHIHVRKKRKTLIGLNIFHMVEHSGGVGTNASASRGEKKETKMHPAGNMINKVHHN